MMGCVIDHLSSDHLARVIRRIYIDHAAREIVIEWERSGARDAREAMHFRLDARQGPRNGAMKEYFEVVEYSPGPRPPRAAPKPPEPLPDGDPSSASASNVWALAARGRFKEAHEQLLRNDTDRQLLADQIGAAAEAHAFDADGAVYDWLKDWCIDLWYQWGAQSTSGGEGTARRAVMDVAERRFEALERQRLQFRPRIAAPQ